MEKLREFSWLFKSSLFVVAYAVIALVVYDIVAEIHIQPPRTLFTSIDHAIPFISAFVVSYVFIFYPFIIFTLGYFAFVEPQKINQYFTAILIVYATSYLTYIVFPVMMIRPSPEELPTDFLSKVMAKYYSLDPPLNCFPSLHAANSTLAAYFLSREKPKHKWAFWGIAFLIILSTLFVRQHVIADEISGFVVAYFASWISEKKIKEEKIPDAFLKGRKIFTAILASLLSIYIISLYTP